MSVRLWSRAGEAGSEVRLQRCLHAVLPACSSTHDSTHDCDHPIVLLLPTAHGQAEHLIQMATPFYHRSSTARAGSDEKRTSHSATLPSTDDVVRAVRERISFYCGYPEANIEPLQAVRYHPGEFYKPHHDYYNACETWQAGNRHFTFLIYLNDVASGGETAFPRLNLTVTPYAFAALVFNNW